ncbi:hypothetical protein [Actinophytocola glycyrrhizae]|uniref:Uncharacterized protein n=1 Tax=Actinophytocola glycyrrhizae TaxID=2044873 RepID=A0ABV9RX70_9PSEU
MWRQLGLTWLAGSAVTGTLAILFTTGTGGLPFIPLWLLSATSVFTLAVLLFALGVATLAIGWRTQHASWLPNGGRGVLLWTVLVAGGGLAGWGYAAAVTFHAEFAHTAQLVLAYTCGGLPFALVAGLLAKPKRMNLAAAGLAAIALPSGYVLLDGRLSLLVMYLQMMFGPAATTW